MTNILQSIETVVADIVLYAEMHAERYELYCVECDKPSHSYNHSRANRCFNRAKKYAEYSVHAAESAGLNPRIVTSTCWNFLDRHKGAK